MERTDVATSLGVIPLWAPAGALTSGKPVVLVITGAWAEANDMMKTPGVVGPAWDAAVMRLPGNGTPWLAETSIEAWAEAVGELIETALAGRAMVLVGLSVGALLALAVRSPQVRRIVAVEPPLVMSKLWPMAGALAARWREVPEERAFLAAVFGVTGEATREERTWWRLFDGAPPVDMVLGEVPLLPPRDLPRFPSFVDGPERDGLRTRPRIRVIEVPGAGHNIHVFAPEKLRDVLLEALERASAEPPLA